MANFFEGIGNALKHPIDEVKWMWDSTKGVLSGDKKLKDIPGDHQEMMNDITVPLLGNNKLAKNSDAVAGAVVGGILAAPMLAGAGGGSAAGGSFSLGNPSSYFNPIKGALSSGMDSVGGMWDSMAGPSDDVLGNLADMEAGGAVDAGLGKGSDALKKAGAGADFTKMAKILGSIKGPEQQQIQHSGGKAGGGFRFDKGQYSNDLLTREYQQMYQQPLYNKLV